MAIETNAVDNMKMNLAVMMKVIAAMTQDLSHVKATMSTKIGVEQFADNMTQIEGEQRFHSAQLDTR